MSRPLSPAAQAVLDAAYTLPLKNGQPSIAAVLYAAAHHLPNDRRVLAAIADELGGRADG
jgi:hypothetical protein